MASDNRDSEADPSAGHVFTNHIVLYLDFLGVSDAASTWEEERAADLIAVLQTIAAARAPYAIGGESLPDGSYKIKATAETSTFSDHIVASYPLLEETQLPISFLMDMYLKLAQDMVSNIAVKALNVGLLVRGAMTIGKLFHSDGVVFGEAMIDAYKLESRVAIYPEFVLSFSNSLESGMQLPGRLLRDFDGIWHLNYFTQMTSDVDVSDRNEWRAACQAMIDQNIHELGSNERWNEFAKWSWFREKFASHVQ